MKEPLDQQIVDFYRSLAPRDATSRALVDAGLAAAVVASNAFARRRFLALSGVAAGLAAGFLAGYRVGSTGRSQDVPVPPTREVSRPADRPPAMRPGRVSPEEIARSSESTDPEELRGKPALATIPYVEEDPGATPGRLHVPVPRLVLAQVSAEWCPRSPTVRPIFDDLARRHGNESIVLVTFDVTDPARRRQAAYVARSLGILEIMGHKWEPGMIQLVDTQRGAIIESLRTAEDVKRIESALAAILVPVR